MSAFQPGAFQATGFQSGAATAAAPQPTGGGYGWNAWDHEARRRIELKRLLEEIERLEAHIAEEREVPPEQVRVESIERTVSLPLPKPVKRVVQRAFKLQTLGALEHAEVVLRRLIEQEEEEFAVLVSLALH